MSTAALKEHGVSYSVSEEARTRIVDARVRELVFVIRRFFAKGAITQDDAEVLATVVLKGIDSKAHVDREFVIDQLVASGRTRHKAETLSSALFK